jgi:hypothetical protein
MCGVLWASQIYAIACWFRFQWAPSDTVSLDAALIKSNTFQAALSI